ncbi:MAG: hypothetical protein ACREGR_01720 [Minisyncoccia bacterium]
MIDYQLTIYNNNEMVELWAAEQFRLTELAGQLTQVYATLLCKGAYRFTTTREEGVGHLILRVMPNVPVQPIQCAHYGRLQALVEEKILPFSLPEVWRPSDEDKLYARIGHQWCRGKQQLAAGGTLGKSGTTLLEYPQLRGDMSIAQHAYFMADTTVTFFFFGATRHKMQFSLNLLQHHFNHGCSDQERRRIWGEDMSPCYPPDGTVKLLI